MRAWNWNLTVLCRPVSCIATRLQSNVSWVPGVWPPAIWQFPADGHSAGQLVHWSVSPQGRCMCTSWILCPQGPLLVCVSRCTGDLSANECLQYASATASRAKAEANIHKHLVRGLMKCLYVDGCHTRLDHCQNASAAVKMVAISSYAKQLHVSLNDLMYLVKTLQWSAFHPMIAVMDSSWALWPWYQEKVSI